jgi:hypothetical protein
MQFPRRNLTWLKLIPGQDGRIIGARIGVGVIVGKKSLPGDDIRIAVGVLVH